MKLKIYYCSIKNNQFKHAIISEHYEDVWTKSIPGQGDMIRIYTLMSDELENAIKLVQSGLMLGDLICIAVSALLAPPEDANI